MLKDGHLDRIRRGLEEISSPVSLVFHPPERDTGFSRMLEQSASRIASASGNVEVRIGDGEDVAAFPALTLSCRGRSNIHYMALPEGPEAEPFVETLLSLGRGETSEDEEWARRLASLEDEREIIVFIAPDCPHCPHAVTSVLRIALVSPRVTTYIVDATAFPEFADRYAIRSVPLTLIDRGLMLTGVVSTDDVVEQLLARDRADYDARVFRSLVEGGRMGDAAEMMLEPGGERIFLEAWERSTMSTRLGLMLAAEEALSYDPRGLDRLVAGLVALLHSPDPPLRGDTADLLGKIGHSDAEKALEEALSDPNPDVAEVAADSLEAIRKSHN